MQRIRVTWEFSIDDAESARSIREYLDKVTSQIHQDVAVDPDVRIVRLAWVMPKGRRRSREAG